MSAVSVPPVSHANTSNAVTASPARHWIISSWADVAFIILTPLLATPAILILYSSWVGVTAETISAIVAAFFAAGHHLPGMIRAYGDRELFERFRWRFLLAPPLLFLAYFPLYTYHFDLYRLIILVWATWHGLMQVYGFARIYDAKVGSVSPVTARWDWALCLAGFITPQLIRPEKVSNALRQWDSTFGFSIPAAWLPALQWGSLAISFGILLGYGAHVVLQGYRGVRPSSLKLLVLASSIGLWWFSMLCVEHLLLGVALFDICHDVQYLAIVWLFNCRRVSANPQLGRFMQYVFRRGMVLLYLGLITAYGAMAFVGPLVLDGTVNRIFYGILFTSTILHYYYDGFIWKVRESTNQAGLGLAVQSPTARVRQMVTGNASHFLKWSPAIVGLGLLFATDLIDPPLSTSGKESLAARYAQSVMGTSRLPEKESERSWLFEEFQRTQAIAAAVPNDREAQLRSAIFLANFGRNDEAIEKLKQILSRHPDYCAAQMILGQIHAYRGNFDQAETCFLAALSLGRTAQERADANLKLGEMFLARQDTAAADAKFAEALADNPQLRESIQAIRKQASPPGNTP